MSILTANFMGRRRSRIGASAAVWKSALAVMVLAASISLSGTAQADTDYLRIAVSSRINTLNPTQTTIISSDMSPISHIYSSLVRRDADLAIVPDAAKSWEMVDATTWRFDLVPGIKFADGEPLDAATVKWNIEYVLNEGTKARLRSLMAPVVESVEVVDETTVLIHTKAPYLPMLQLMAHVFLLPPEWASAPGRNLSQEVMGTGAYELKEFTGGERIVLEAKKEFYGAAPQFRRIDMVTMTEASSRVAALLAGEVDYVRDIPFAEVDRINASGVGTAGVIASTRAMMVHFNTLSGPFKDNVPLRRALNYAVNKQEIVDALYNGMVEPGACQIVPTTNFGYDPDLKPIEYNPEKAKQLLAEAGYPNGFSFKLEVPTARYLQAEEISQIIAAQLEQVGVHAQLEEVDFAGWQNRYVGKQIEAATYSGLTSLTLDADFILTAVSTGSFGYWNDSRFIDAVSRARIGSTEEERMVAYKEAAKLMCDEAPMIFLFPQPLIYATSKETTWHARGDEWVQYYDFQKSK